MLCGAVKRAVGDSRLPAPSMETALWEMPRAVRAFVCALVLILLMSTLALTTSLSPAGAQAPTLPGAPFIAVAERTDHVLERLDALLALEDLERAQENLSLREETEEDPSINLEETERILEARVAALERTLEELSESEGALLAETEEFGLGLAVFPVDEVRKPFWDDWGQPRSGGRTHVGTDVLAQIGVPLRAIEDGEVETITSGGAGGNGIFMIGESGARWFYAHMDEVGDLAPGDPIFAGQIVGTIGDTGNARGAPHLHMQWAPTGGSNWENPFPMLDVLFGEGRTTAFAEQAADVLTSQAEAALTNADG